MKLNVSQSQFSPGHFSRLPHLQILYLASECLVLLTALLLFHECLEVRFDLAAIAGQETFDHPGLHLLSHLLW